RLRVECSESWDRMPMLTGDARHCASCAKAVTDVSALSDEDLRAWLSAHPQACARYSIAQLRPDLKPVPALSRELTRGAFAALAALTLTTAHAQGDRAVPAATEQVAVPRPSDAPQMEEVERMDEERCWREKDEDVAPSTKAVKRARYYYSKRFPFIHRYRYRMGFF
ncbi:MAG: hypothetical protein WAT74_16500, partial [Flavobacteriales bacterium]